MSSQAPIRIVIVDENKLARIGWKTVLDGESGIVVVGEAEDGHKALPLIKELCPDVVIMSLRMRGINCLDIAEELDTVQRAKMIVLAPTESEEELLAALAARAEGYCAKDLDSKLLGKMVRTIHEGGAWFDPYIAGTVLDMLSRNGSPDFIQLTEEESRLLRVMSQNKSLDELCDVLGRDLDDCKESIAKLLDRLCQDGRVQRAATKVREMYSSERRRSQGRSQNAFESYEPKKSFDQKE